MGCCSTKGCNEFFTDRVARRDAGRYRRRGLDSTAKRLVGLVSRRGVEGRTVLEVGGGIGAIQIALLRAGAARAEIAEISPAYEPYAARLLEEAGLSGRVERRLIDFAEHADDIGSADIVILHRVMCCYPDCEALAAAAADHARQVLMLTYPREVWWTRLGIAAANLLERLRGRSFRVYLHSPATIVAIARSHGLEPTDLHQGRIWELRGFERATGGSSA